MSIQSVVGSSINWKIVKSIDDLYQQLIMHNPAIRGPLQLLKSNGNTYHITTQSMNQVMIDGPTGFVLGIHNGIELEGPYSSMVDNVEAEEHSYDYDLIVIGGGSGGLSAAKNASKYGKKVALLDFVKPSPYGTSWGLGGTCVNVGCIPKKLMHQASLLGEAIKDSKSFGWSNNNNNNNNSNNNNNDSSNNNNDVVMKENDHHDQQQQQQQQQHNWNELVNNVQDHIGSLNWGYSVELVESNVKYINAFGSFIDPHTIETIDRKKRKTTISARRIIIAVGGRPNTLGIPGEELAISSDDLFSLSHPPGDTLVIGAAYIALECAGFLAGLGYKTSVMVRSIILRGFDQNMAEKVTESMLEVGVKFIRPAVPTKIEKIENSEKLKVYWKDADGVEQNGIFDTVLAAVGRHPVTDGIGLEKAGVKTNPKTGKINCVNERTNVPHIYAIGDVVEGYPELTPVAIKAGKMLTLRLYDKKTHYMDYSMIPTVIFTPLEYGTVGFSEEDAISKFGEADIEVYHSYFKPLELTLVHERENPNPCYIKVICKISENERVIGFHIICPHAGEITQGFSLAMKAGLYKCQLNDNVGIHPTIAEEFTTLTITKRSGDDPMKKGC